MRRVVDPLGLIHLKPGPYVVLAVVQASLSVCFIVSATRCSLDISQVQPWQPVGRHGVGANRHWRTGRPRRRGLTGAVDILRIGGGGCRRYACVSAQTASRASEVAVARRGL